MKPNARAAQFADWSSKRADWAERRAAHARRLAAIARAEAEQHAARHEPELERRSRREAELHERAAAYQDKAAARQRELGDQRLGKSQENRPFGLSDACGKPATALPRGPDAPAASTGDDQLQPRSPKRG